MQLQGGLISHPSLRCIKQCHGLIVMTPGSQPSHSDYLQLPCQQMPLALGQRPSIELGCPTGKARDRGCCREGEVRRRISATLIDRYLSPQPLAWKNTRSSMSTEINKRKPPDRSSPPLWFSRGLAVTFPQDKVVTKVTHLFSQSLKGKGRVGGDESGWVNLCVSH